MPSLSTTMPFLLAGSALAVLQFSIGCQVTFCPHEHTAWTSKAYRSLRPTNPQTLPRSNIQWPGSYAAYAKSTIRALRIITSICLPSSRGGMV